MDETIGFRDYIDVLVRRWKWILGLTVTAALTGGLASFRAPPPTYEATAQVFIPSNAVITTLPLPLAFIQSQAVATQALQSLGAEAGNESVGTLSRKVRVINDSKDTTIFHITAQADTPQKAVAIANTWAATAIQAMTKELEELNAMALSKQQEKQRRAALALERLEQANQALADFVEKNGLASKGAAPAFFRIPTQPVVLQGPPESLDLSPSQMATLSRLLYERDIAGTAYSTLLTQVIEGEAMIWPPAVNEEPPVNDVPSPVLLNEATLPDSPTVQPKPLQQIALGGMLGLMAGLFTAFVIEYFAQPKKAGGS